MSNATDLTVDGLAAWRLTHLVVKDEFPPVKAARDAVLDHFGPDSSISYLVGCPYCVGVWAGLAVKALRARRRGRWLLGALAAASFAPLIEGALLKAGVDG